MLTLQQLYEKLIRLSLEHATSDSPLKQISNAIDDIYATSIDEICIKADLLGMHIEKKANFTKFGETYLIQCLYFLESINDHETLAEFLKCITTYKILQSIANDEFKSHCYELYVSNILKNHDIACSLSEYIVSNCSNSCFYDDFKRLAKSTCIYASSIPFETIMS